MAQQFFEELSRCLRKEQIESYNKEDRRLEIFLHGQPVLSVSPGNEVFLLPAGSKNPEANELYHRVAIAADSAFEYVEAMENTPLLRARGLENKFHLLADFGGAVLAGRERAAGQGYEFVTWIWDYEKVGVSHGHYYEDDFAGAKRDFAVRSGLISNASLFSKEELTELYRATEHLLADDPDLNDKQMKAIQEARTKIEFSVPDLDTQLEHRQDSTNSALRWLLASVEQGNVHAEYALAMAYLKGESVPKDSLKAMELLKRASSREHQFAQYQLGKLLLQGEDVPKDIVAAVHWLTASAMHGNQYAQYALGKLYLLGKGVEKDKDRAAKWFQMAANQGNEYAQYYLKHMDDPMGQSPAAAVITLFHSLANIFREQNQLPSGGIMVAVDRKLLRKIKAKKIAQGHKADDHEPKIGLQ